VKSDLLTQLNDYGKYVEGRLPTITADDVTVPADNVPTPTYPTRRIQPLRGRVPGWAVAAVAALVVLVVVGGAALLFRGDAPVTDPASPTTIPVIPTTQPAVLPPVISSDPVDGTAIGATLTGVDTPGDINAGEKWLWVDDTTALYRIDPTTLEMTPVDYGRNSDQQRTITISSHGPWLTDPGFGDIVGVDTDTATLALDWLFPSDTIYVHNLVAGGEALWANATSEDGTEIVKLDPDTGAVITRVNADQSVFNPLIFEDGSLWATWRRGGAKAPWVVVRFDTELEVVAEIELPNVSPGFYFNDQMVSGDGHIFLTGYVCDCPDPFSTDDPIGRIVRIDPATNTIVTKPIAGVSEYGEGLDLGFGPFLDLAYGDGWLWGVRLVDDWETRDIVRIDPNTLEIVGGPITTEPLPWAIEVAFGRLWITHYNDGVITIIDLADLY
jgi:hypothetical protein